MRGLLENSNTVSETIFKSIMVLIENNKPLEILLNGLYGLIDVGKAKDVFSMIWNELKDGKEKLSKMVAIRVSTDLIVKYNLLKQMASDDADLS
jgi:hypothetical protein